MEAMAGADVGQIVKEFFNWVGVVLESGCHGESFAVVEE